MYQLAKLSLHYLVCALQCTLVVLYLRMHLIQPCIQTLIDLSNRRYDLDILLPVFDKILDALSLFLDLPVQLLVHLFSFSYKSALHFF